MARAETSQVDELAPEPAYQALKETVSAAMVDVRTRAEWAFVGLPDLDEIGKDLWPVEWVQFPDMSPNDQFMQQLLGRAGGELPERLFFICRTGSRSLAAARKVAMESQAMGQAVHCTNVAEGFEGDLDQGRHRGSRNGWKARGLPWQQS